MVEAIIAHIHEAKSSFIEKDLIAFQSLSPTAQQHLVSRLLNDVSPQVRAEAYEMMSWSPMVQWPGNLFLHGLCDVDRDVRFNAARFAAELNCKGCANYICTAYGRETEIQVKVEFVKSLIRLQATGCLPETTSGDQREKWMLAYAQYLCGKVAEEQIVQLLGSLDPEMRVFAGGVVAYFNEMKGRHLLLALEQDQEQTVRESAKRSLFRMDLSKSIRDNR